MWLSFWKSDGHALCCSSVGRTCRKRLIADVTPSRKPKHDIGSVQNIVLQYVRQRQMLRAGGDTKGRDANAGKRREKVNKKK